MMIAPFMDQSINGDVAIKINTGKILNLEGNLIIPPPTLIIPTLPLVLHHTIEI